MVVLPWLGCGPSSVPDPRCAVEGNLEHQTWFVKRINKSKLWRAYLEYKDPSETRRLVKLRLTMDRTTVRSTGGDYDPGTVTVRFAATSLTNRRTLYSREERVDLPAFELGLFDGNAGREEIQEAVFEATEERVYPFVGRWIEIAALRAIAEEGRQGGTLVPVLEELLADPWTPDDMRSEAQYALERIH